jgi:ThiF family
MKGREIKPVLIRGDVKAKALIRQKPYITFVNAFDDQLKELFFIENHKFIGQIKKEVYKTDAFHNFCHKNRNLFVYVYFPWNHTLVKTITKDKYLTLKTNRNQDLITAKEQLKLRKFNVAVLGMSVGSNIVFVLTQAGISNSVTIADFDALSTTNLNRILAGVHQIGLNKTVIAARKIYEDNPFAEVRTLPHGVTTKNLEALLKKGMIHCIIEEIDNMPMKIETRMLAIKYKIPVIMITDNGDGVVLHVERYDLGHNMIFGKNISYWKEIMKEPITMQKAGEIIMKNIVGIKNVDPKMIKSVMKVMKKELVSWSQLGSAAILGGAVATIALKNIVLGPANKKFITEYINALK